MREHQGEVAQIDLSWEFIYSKASNSFQQVITRKKKKKRHAIILEEMGGGWKGWGNTERETKEESFVR